VSVVFLEGRNDSFMMYNVLTYAYEKVFNSYRACRLVVGMFALSVGQQ